MVKVAGVRVGICQQSLSYRHTNYIQRGHNTLRLAAVKATQAIKARRARNQHRKRPAL
jgi:hypothetical protein